MTQNSEQIARDQIDKLLPQSGRVIQNKNQISFHIGERQAVQKCQTGTSCANYIQLIADKPGDVIEAKVEQYGREFLSAANCRISCPHRAPASCHSARAFSGHLIGEINSDALPVVGTVSLDWLMAAKSDYKYQIIP